MGTKRKFVKACGLFVTGTDTEIGKTLVTGAIAHVCARAGHRVGVFKPVASGCIRRREGLVSTDAEFLAHCSNSPFSLAQITPARYTDPVAPSVAVERTGDGIDWDEISRCYRTITRRSDFTLVEGVGGAMVPLEGDYLVTNLMCDLGLPVLIVAGSQLGTINHTLMTVETCRRHGLTVAGIVINRYPADHASIAQETAPRIISELTKVNVLTVIPVDPKTCTETGSLGPEAAAAAALVDWADLINRKPNSSSS